ncbi:MAG: ATP-dependent RNA helicase HrpA [Gammaproteobacteria bacterium]
MRANGVDVLRTRQAMTEALQKCMLAHRSRLEARLRRLNRAPAEELPRLRAQLETDIKASAACLLRRRQTAPRPNYAAELPIVHEKSRIADTIRQHQTVIVCGETGSGKSTQLPKICLGLGRGAAGLIGHTQPRRIAARSIAARIAEELGSPLGDTVGFKVRFSDRVGDNTYIKLMTDGILLAEMRQDRWLRQYDTLIIDEAHERSLNIDFLLGYLKDLLPRRPELRLIIASATIEPHRFAQYFNDAPIIEVSGRSYPVEVRYRPPPTADKENQGGGDTQAMLDAVDEILRIGPGDVLVFLPGEREIHETADNLRKHRADIEIVPLYARLSPAEQNRVFKPHHGRRIVLATNVAETSLTVPGIHYVIDTGLARISRYSVRRKVQRLATEPVSQASARQRLGRCGRLAAGVCIRLYAQDDLEARPAFTDPEVKRTNLASVILQMAQLGLGSAESFPFLDPPDRRYINDGYKLLEMLGAVDVRRELTKTGRQLARLPIDPRLGRILLAARAEGCLSEILIITSLLATQDPRLRPAEKPQPADEKHRQFMDPRSDFLTLLRLWRFVQPETTSSSRLRKLCERNFLSYVRLREWQDVHRQLGSITRVATAHAKNRDTPRPAAKPADDPDYAAIHKALLAGFPDQIGCRDENKDFIGARGLRFSIFPGSGLHQKPPKWVVAAELAETARLYARTVAEIRPQWAAHAAPHLIKREYFDPHWQTSMARVSAYERVTLYGLVLESCRRVDYGRIDPSLAHEIFVRETLVEGRYQTRAGFFRHNRKLIDEIEKLEARARRRDMLIHHDDLYRFYSERIPPEIHTGAAFEQWLKADDRHARCLYLTRSQLTRHAAEQVSARDFPPHMEVGGTRLPLSYRFEPGHDEDGATLKVPLALLNQLDADRCEWLVPGLLKEKIIALIKGLPKSLRRNFVPAPDFAQACTEALPAADGKLIEALTATLKRMTGVEIPREAWSESSLPPHLRLRFEVLDGEKQVDQGRDLKALQARWGDRATADFRSLHTFERSGLTRWDFGWLPEFVETEQAGARVKGYPALVDDGDSVSLQLMDTPATAQRHARAGVRRLYMLSLEEQVRYLHRNLRATPDLCLYYQPIGHCESLLTELIETAFDRAFIDRGPLPRDPGAFEARRQSGRGALIEIADALVAEVKLILTLHHRIRRQLNSSRARSWPAAAADMDSQLKHLVYAGFIRQTPAHWLTQLPRYLQAVQMRVEKLAQDPSKDRPLQDQIDPLWQRCLAAFARDDHARRDGTFQDYRWMVEEHRVSLFAQRLGTAVKTSAKRLETQWEQARRALP